MPLKFLHIVPDDKFIDLAISFFHDFGGNHSFVCPSEERVCSYNYIINEMVHSLTFDECKLLIIDGEYDICVFHTLYAELYSLVLCVPKGKTVIWNSWGADIYYERKGYRSIVNLPIYKPLTKEFLYGRVGLVKKVKRFIKRFIPPGRLQRERNLMQKKAISRVDLCSTIIRSEYDRLSRLSFFKAEYLPFNYVRKKKLVVSHIGSEATSILINNSADLSGNHVDILNCLRKRGIINSKVIPISYGKDKWLIKKAISPFINNDSDLVLDRFLSIQEYSNLVHHCRAAVFGHIRQQALGNINLCLMAGIKVFLYEDSLLYKYFGQIGIRVFSIEKDLTQQSVNEPLDESEVNHNCCIIRELYDYDHVMSRVKSTLERTLKG